jgi:hypothetical protein
MRDSAIIRLLLRQLRSGGHIPANARGRSHVDEIGARNGNNPSRAAVCPHEVTREKS